MKSYHSLKMKLFKEITKGTKFNTNGTDRLHRKITKDINPLVNEHGEILIRVSKDEAKNIITIQDEDTLNSLKEESVNKEKESDVSDEIEENNKNTKKKEIHHKAKEEIEKNEIPKKIKITNEPIIKDNNFLDDIGIDMADLDDVSEIEDMIANDIPDELDIPDIGMDNIPEDIDMDVPDIPEIPEVKEEQILEKVSTENVADETKTELNELKPPVPENRDLDIKEDTKTKVFDKNKFYDNIVFRTDFFVDKSTKPPFKIFDEDVILEEFDYKKMEKILIPNLIKNSALGVLDSKDLILIRDRFFEVLTNTISEKKQIRENFSKKLKSDISFALSFLHFIQNDKKLCIDNKFNIYSAEKEGEVCRFSGMRISSNILNISFEKDEVNLILSNPLQRVKLSDIKSKQNCIW